MVFSKLNGLLNNEIKSMLGNLDNFIGELDKNKGVMVNVLKNVDILIS